MCYYSIVIICIKFFSKINILCFHIKLLVELFPGDMQNIHMEDKSLSLSVSVVTKRKWRTQVLVKQSSQNKKAWCRVLNIEISDNLTGSQRILPRIEQNHIAPLPKMKMSSVIIST